MYVAIVSIKMCLSINDISKCGGEYNIARKVDIVLGMHYRILNLCNKINKCICKKYVASLVINYQHALITFVITIRVALQEY